MDAPECYECLAMFEDAGGCECMRNNCENMALISDEILISDECYNCREKVTDNCGISNNEKGKYLNQDPI